MALSAGAYLVARACRRLPAGIREERYEEWVAELPVILHDRDAGPALLRVVHMLTFAADTLRGTTLAAGAYQHQGAHRRDDFENSHALALSLSPRASQRRELPCSSGRSPASAAGVTRCCLRSLATAAARSRPPASASPWLCW